MIAPLPSLRCADSIRARRRGLQRRIFRNHCSILGIQLSKLPLKLRILQLQFRILIRQAKGVGIAILKAFANTLQLFPRVFVVCLRAQVSDHFVDIFYGSHAGDNGVVATFGQVKPAPKKGARR